MKKTVFLIINGFLLISCNYNSSLEKPDNKPPCPTISQFVNEAFQYFIEHEDAPDTSTIYKMTFINGASGFSEEDTLMEFCQMLADGKEKGLRGLIHIEDYKVLIFDEKKIGTSFYNMDSVKEVDLNNLRLSTFEDIICCCAFVLNGGKYLELIGCQPDDFIPIKINGRGERELTPSPSKKQKATTN